MVEFFIPVALTGLMAIMAQDRTREITQGEKDAVSLRMMVDRDNREMGLNWSQQRVTDLHLTNLNAANKPYSAPTQQPTYNLADISWDNADRNTYLSVYNPNFFFRNNIEIPYTSAASATYNVEIPSRQSIRGDFDAHLARNPRVFVNPSYEWYAYKKCTSGAMGAGESEVWDEEYVPETGQLNYFMYPYGPGGAIQRLWNNRNERVTRQQGTNRATLIGPPVFNSSIDSSVVNNYL